MKENIFGTIITILFDLIVIGMITLLCKTVPSTISIIVSIILGGTACGATFKICKYGFNKIKEKWNLKRKQ